MISNKVNPSTLAFKKLLNEEIKRAIFDVFLFHLTELTSNFIADPFELKQLT